MKLTRSSVLAALIVSLFMFPVFASAADMSIGVSSWYAWWKLEQGSRKSIYDPAILYGPVIAIGFTPRWSLSSLFLYGRYDMDSGDGAKEKIDRYDSDTALNYSLNKYFKIFAGPKFMGYTGSGFSHLALGPALGMGITLPLSDSFFVLWNVSGVYLWGKHEESDPDGDSNFIYREPGLNTNASLAYYIEGASTTITLGFRYQIFGTYYDSDRETDMTHQFYGATLSAVYSFEL